MSVLFKNATVIDGTASPRYNASVLVTDSTISAITLVSAHNALPLDAFSGTRVIDCTGKILCPGFMDIHAHSDLEVLRNPSMSHKVQQGITFDLSGNCGAGVYPRHPNDIPAFADILGHYENWFWTDFKSYKASIRPGINMGFLQPHSFLRMMAIEGNPNKKANKNEISKMCSLLEKSLDQGCLGLSTGLYYAPCLFADHDELISLLKVIHDKNALFCVHHRCEGDEILQSIDEIIDLVRKTNVRLEVSHLKAIGRKNQDKMPEVLKKLHQLKSDGFDVAFDQYPYEYGSTSLFSLLPPKLLKLSPEDLSQVLKKALTDKKLKDSIINEMESPHGWDSISELCPWEDISIVTMESSPDFNGLKLSDVAKKLQMDPYQAFFYILSKENGYALMADITQSPQTLRMVFEDEMMCFGTDALYTGTAAHPRSANAAIHLLCTRCKNENYSFELVINKMTGKVANRLGLKDQGKIAQGYKANIVVFDAATLRDNSTTENPFAMCTGLDFVMVNGVFALDSGHLTGAQAGSVIVC